LSPIIQKLSSPGAAAGWAAWLDEAEETALLAAPVLPVAKVAALLVFADGWRATDAAVVVVGAFVMPGGVAPQAESSAVEATTTAAPQACSNARRLCM